MIVQTLAFYLFAFLVIASGILVVSVRNPVHSVLYLILAFFSAAGLFILLGAEFLAMLLIIVYVGAVAVLFLFVVMMLDIDFVELKKGMLQYLPIGGLIGLILLVELIFMMAVRATDITVATGQQHPIPDVSEISNTKALGHILYTDYFFLFQAAGMILLVAMIGAIVLTLRHRENVKRQSISEQVQRRPEDAFELRDIKPGQGLN